jgi:beta-lactamase superfamily II metal-dependent hydrolase
MKLSKENTGIPTPEESRTRRFFLRSAASGTALFFLPGVKEVLCGEYVKRGSFLLWQLPPQTKTQMNSYVIRTSGGRVIVIDGGNTGDAAYLKGFLGALGNHVHHWFISHPHSDHLDALTAILREPAVPKIDVIHGSFPSTEWIARYEPGEEKALVSFTEAREKKGLPLQEHTLGEVLAVDGVRFEILGIKNPEITQNAVNNSSVLMHVSGGGKTVLFPGDLGVEGGRKTLDSPFKKKLLAEYVQMAHHGQNGVSEEFYREVQPSFCLWPTPDWLWDNDNGGGKGSGPWATLTVRGWMEKLGIKKHFIAKDGLARIE